MKLLIASDNFLPRWDGISRFLVEIAPALNKSFDVSYMVPEGKERITKKKFSIKFSRIRYGDFIIPVMPLITASKAVKENDVIFTQTIGPIGLSAILMAKIHRKKVVSFVHSIESELVPKAVGKPWLRQLVQPLAKIYTRLVYKMVDKIIAPSEGVIETLAWMKIKKVKKIVQLGTNTKQFSPGKELALRKELGLTKEFIIGYHGRIAWEKDVLTLLRAFVRLKRKYDNIKLLIVGSGVNKIVRKLELTEGVIVVPATPEVEKYLRIMNIYVMPSLTETTCLSVLEAMATKLPVISTPVGYVEDYIDEGVSGLFFHKKDSFMLSKSIELLLTNPSLRKKLGNNARRVVENKFKWSITSKRIVEELNQL